MGMTDVEYVAVVRIERVERRVEPSSVPSRRATGDQKVVRDKAEVASFTLRAPTVHQIRGMVRDVMAAALADNVKGEPDLDDDEEEEDDR